MVKIKLSKKNFFVFNFQTMFTKAVQKIQFTKNFKNKLQNDRSTNDSGKLVKTSD